MNQRSNNAIVVRKRNSNNSTKVKNNEQGTSSGIITSWNTTWIELVHTRTMQHLIYINLMTKELRITISIFNTFVLITIQEKGGYWGTLEAFLDIELIPYCIIVGYLNLVLKTEQIKELIVTWGLIDVKPKQRMYTYC